jgi:hypothetical protein
MVLMRWPETYRPIFDFRISSSRCAAVRSNAVRSRCSDGAAHQDSLGPGAALPSAEVPVLRVAVAWLSWGDGTRRGIPLARHGCHPRAHLPRRVQRSPPQALLVAGAPVPPRPVPALVRARGARLSTSPGGRRDTRHTLFVDFRSACRRGGTPGRPWRSAVRARASDTGRPRRVRASSLASPAR